MILSESLNCEQINKDFQTYLSKHSITHPEFFTMKIFSISCWRGSEKVNDHEWRGFPEQMEGAKTLYESFYQLSHNGTRRVVWKHLKGSVDLKFKAKKTANLHCTEPQTISIFAIERGRANTIEALCLLTNISSEILKPSLDKLVEKKVLAFSNSQYTIDGDYDFPPAIIDCKPKTIAKKAEDDASAKNLKQQRDMILDSQIVRIMKSRNRLNLNGIVEHCMKSIELFKPEVRDIKARIESLISREYLKRDENDMTVLIYLA